jgi:hypothetical protein
MKKLLLITLLLLKFKFSGAQSWIYHPFPADSAIWVQQHVDWDGTPSYSRSYFIGDTVIGAFTYHKVYYSMSMYYAAGGYYPGPVSTVNPLYAIREDVPAEKVYRLDTYTGAEKLLYDFSLHIGDIAFVDSIVSPYDTIVVTGIDSVIAGGSYHKRLLLSSVQGMVTPGNWVEGVGSEAGLAEYFTGGFEFSNQLVALCMNGIVQYPYYSGSPAPNCEFFLGIKETRDNIIEVVLGPNPVKDEIGLQMSCMDTYSVELMNAAGEMILSKKNLQLSAASFDIGTFAKGVYFVRISNSKGNSVTKQIIKQ